MKIKLMEKRFRAWDKVSKNMYYWTLNCILGRLEGSEYTARPSFDWMQFTGRQDRNGRDIYEGDIVCVDEHNSIHKSTFIKDGIYTVVWFQTAWHLNDEDDLDDDLPPEKTMEIIGNIYENPEMAEPLNDDMCT